MVRIDTFQRFLLPSRQGLLRRCVAGCHGLLVSQGRQVLLCGLAIAALALAAPAWSVEPGKQSAPADGPAGRNDAKKVAAEFQELPNVTYVKRDKLELKGDLFIPNGKGPFPSVLMVHGGAWRGGSKQLSTLQSRELATHGYTVLAINYRLAPEFKFPAQLDDCRDAVRFLRKEAAHYKVDPTRVAGCGYSAGGHLVCLLGTETDDAPPAGGVPAATPGMRLQAVVAGGAPTDFRLISPDSAMLSYWLGGTRREKPEQYAAASPLAAVKAGDPPMFLYHGQQDTLVPSLSALAMVARLKQQQVPAELYMVDGAGHIGAYLDRKAFVAAMAFLDKTLKGAAKPQ